MALYRFLDCAITFYRCSVSPDENVYGKYTENVLSLCLTGRCKSLSTFVSILPKLCDMGKSGFVCMF